MLALVLLAWSATSLSESASDAYRFLRFVADGNLSGVYEAAMPQMQNMQDITGFEKNVRALGVTGYRLPFWISRVATGLTNGEVSENSV